jgi:hypothetical protein
MKRVSWITLLATVVLSSFTFTGAAQQGGKVWWVR